MLETWIGSLGQGDSLEEEMASHSSILACETPWTEEPDRLQSKTQLSRMPFLKEYNQSKTQPPPDAILKGVQPEEAWFVNKRSLGLCHTLFNLSDCMIPKPHNPL